MSATALDLAAVHHRRRGVTALMVEVMAALVPGTLLHAWLIGPGVLVNLAIAVPAALALEALALRARGHPVRSALADGSIALAAWLLVLALPPTLPAGQLLVGVVATVLLGKHLYGGLGSNPFNPAMVGYAVLIVSFPVTMTAWPGGTSSASPALPPTGIASPSAATLPSSDVRSIPNAAPTKAGADRGVGVDVESRVDAGSGADADADADADAGDGDGDGVQGAGSDVAWDAVTAATPLDRLRTLERQRRDTVANDAEPSSVGTEDGPDARGADTVHDPGAVILASPWPWVNGGFLAGGLWLLARGVIGWRIPLSLLGTLGLLHAAHGAFAAVPQPPVHAELLAGAAILGAFFIATDPVSAASGPRARLVYGAGIGALTFVLREFGAYPEGIAFAVLLMNATVPLLDRGSVPRRGAT